MDYLEIFFHEYCEDKTGVPCRLSILKRGYTGTPMELEAGPVPFVKSMVSSDYPLVGCIKPTMATLYLITGGGFEMRDLYTDDDTMFAVQHEVDGQVDWLGYVTPDGLGETETGGLSVLEVNCFDGLTRLKDLPFLDDTGQNYGARPIPDMYFTELLSVLLAKTRVHLEIHTLVDRVASTSAIPALQPYSVDLSADG